MSNSKPIDPIDAVKYAQWLAKDVWHAIEAERANRSYQMYLDNLNDDEYYSAEYIAIQERIEKLQELQSLLDWYNQHAQSAIYVSYPKGRQDEQ